MKEAIQFFLIEDDQDDQEVFLMILQKINKHIICLTANDGAEALLMLKEKEEFIPDYIFMDVNMPKMNGIDCLKNIKAIQRLKNCKVFMYSTTSENSVLEKSRELGAIDLIVKPSSPGILKEILTKILAN